MVAIIQSKSIEDIQSGTIGEDSVVAVMFWQPLADARAVYSVNFTRGVEETLWEKKFEEDSGAKKKKRRRGNLDNCMDY